MKSVSTTFHYPLVRRTRHLPGALQITDYRRLLQALEVESQESYADEEVPDIMAMALQDIGHRESVDIILSTLFEGQFTPGQAQNLTEELKEDNAWDEYSDLIDHRSLYVCIDLLNSAFPNDYPEPCHTNLQIVIKGKDLDAFLSKQPLDEATLLRGIAQSEEANSILSRLFSQQLEGGAFPEAKWIVWRMETTSTVANERVVDCSGSNYWFRGIESGMESSVELG
jgi:hypothetical protein